MRITDNGMTVDLVDHDPRATRVRAILFEQPACRDPAITLWKACSDPHREVLQAVAKHGEVTQIELENSLGINGIALRGRHSGIAKIAKRLGVEYPIRSVGARREVRRFSLDPDFRRRVLKQVSHDAKNRRSNGNLN